METVRDILNKKLLNFDEDTSVDKVAKALGQYDVGCVIITRNKKPIGIITERDMVRRVIARNLDIKELITKSIMTSPVESLDQNTNIYYAGKVMREKGYQRYPVVGNGKIIGIITQADIIDYFTQQRKKFVLKYLNKSLRKHYLWKNFLNQQNGK